MIIDGNAPAPAHERKFYARLRLKHLQLIEILSRTNTIGKAAAELNLTQSAASKILQDAEAIFGTPLFERNARGLVPTVIGDEVIRYAHVSVSQATRIMADVDALGSGGAGSLSVGAIMVSLPNILSEAISRLRTLRPRLTVHLTSTTSDRIVEMLGKGQLDVGLCRITKPSQKAEFDFEELFDETYWIFADKSHPVAERNVSHLGDLVDYPWVIQPSASPSRQVLEAAFAEAGLPMPLARVETTSRFATLHLVRHARMIGLLPSTLLAEYVAAGDLMRLDVGTLRPAWRYGLLTRRFEPASDQLREFASIVRSIRDPVSHEG